MKKLVYLLIIFLLICGCSKPKEIIKEEINYNIDPNEQIMEYIRINISGVEHPIKLENNDAVKVFLRNVPQEYKMKEKHRNQKYTYLGFTLPESTEEVLHVLKGDIVLSGDNCLIIYYQDADVKTEYTKIGHIENLTSLGNDDIVVRFYK